MSETLQKPQKKLKNPMPGVQLVKGKDRKDSVNKALQQVSWTLAELHAGRGLP